MKASNSRSVAFARRGPVPLMVAALAGCAVPPAAVPTRPASGADGPQARLVMRGEVPAGEGYGVLVYDDALGCTAPRTVGAGAAGRHPGSTSLAADRLATLEFAVVRADKSVCPVRWSFTPQAGRTYLLTGGRTPQGCGARLLDMSDPDRIVPVARAQRRNPPGATARCVALDQSPRAGAAEGLSADGEAVLRPGATADDLRGLIGGR